MQVNARAIHPRAQEHKILLATIEQGTESEDLVCWRNKYT
jgi:hypothetical protein